MALAGDLDHVDSEGDDEASAAEAETAALVVQLRVEPLLRWPEQERSVFGGDDSSLAGYEAAHGLEKGNLAADPQFPINPSDSEDDEASRDQLFNGMVSRIRDFPDLFATNLELIERNVGLIKADFEDFQFHRSGYDQ